MDIAGNISFSCQAHAKTLYYIENDYINDDSIDDLIKLINLYIKSCLLENAIGIYRLDQMKSKNKFNNLLKEKNLHLKMHQWEKLNNKLKKCKQKKKIKMKKI